MLFALELKGEGEGGDEDVELEGLAGGTGVGKRGFLLNWERREERADD